MADVNEQSAPETISAAMPVRGRDGEARQSPDHQIRLLDRWSYAGLVLAIAVLAVLLTFAVHDGPRADFWRTAVPGVLTGIGTLILAGVTVWLSVRQRLTDQHVRHEQRQDLLAAQGAEAAREARKVFAFCQAEMGENEQLIVVNVSPDPIFDVAVSGQARNPISGQEMQWLHGVHQESVGYILPNDRQTFNGHWSELLRVYWAEREVPVTVEWTDGRGTRWIRRGYTGPTPAPATAVGCRSSR